MSRWIAFSKSAMSIIHVQIDIHKKLDWFNVL